MKTKTSGTQVRKRRQRANDRGTVVWLLNRNTGQVAELIRTVTRPDRVGTTQCWKVGDLILEPQRGCGCNHPMYTWVPPED